MSSSDSIDPKKDEEKLRRQAGHNLTICIFLGGFTFTSMTVLMQVRDNFNVDAISAILYYPELLIDGLAAVSALFVMAVIGMSVVASGRDELKSDYGKLAFAFMIAGLLGLCVLLPLLVVPFSLAGAIAIAIIEVVGLLMLHYLSNKHPPTEIRQ